MSSRPDVALRPLELTDWPAVHSWSSLPEVCRYQPWGPNSDADAEEFVRAAVDAWSARPRLREPYAALVDGEVLGMGELHLGEPARHRQGAISYVVHPRVWRRGVGTAIGAGLLRIGFAERGLHRIAATCDPRNAGSAAVLRRLGMAYEGTLRHTMLLRDGWRDSETFSIIEDEWRGTPLAARA